MNASVSNSPELKKMEKIITKEAKVEAERVKKAEKDLQSTEKSGQKAEKVDRLFTNLVMNITDHSYYRRLERRKTPYRNPRRKRSVLPKQ